MSKKKGTTEIKTLTFKEHVKQRSMWLGAPVTAPHELFVKDTTAESDGYFIKDTVEYSDALFKCFDEVMVNALDHYVNAMTFSKQQGGPVTVIKIDFDVATGAITVYNDGQGMPVYLMDDPEKPGTQLYTVEAIISRAFTGSNFEDEKNADRVTGGINGLGIKLVNFMSTFFEVETVDWNNKRYYKQSCENGMDIINQATIYDLVKDKANAEFKKLKPEQTCPHTTVKFIPNYADLCKNGKKSDPDWYNAKRGNELLRVIESRVFQMAAFIASTNYRYDGDKRIDYTRKAKVYFNGELVQINALKDYVELFGLRNYAAVTLSDPKNYEHEPGTQHIKFPWSIVVNVSQNAIENDGESDFKYDDVEYKKFEQMNILNGVYLPGGGSHINQLINMLDDALHLRIEKTIGKQYRDESDKKKFKPFPAEILKNNLFIFNCIQIPIPQFAGQTKDSVTLNKTELNQFKQIYELPKTFIVKVWELLKPVLEYKFLIKDGKKSKTKQNFVRKYHKAKQLGPNSQLIVPEGDSAEGTMNAIITNKKANLGYKNTGSYNIQGVPMNALKQIKEITVGSHSRIKQSRLLQTNAALQGLAQVLGLNYDFTYYYSDALNCPAKLKKLTAEEKSSEKAKQKQGDKEFNTLKYGSMIVAVDQDTDGIGQIFGLLLTFMHVFFPNLIKRGFIKRFATPLIRVYPVKKKEDAREFYSLAEFKVWRKEHFGIEGSVEDAEDIPKNLYRVKYYKGLATHSPAEIQHMAECFNDNVYTYSWDEACNKYIEIMYGNDTNLRKIELRTPVTAEYDQPMFEQQIVKISDQLRIETKTFQLEFLERKLPSAIDGMIPAQRKAFAGARRIWAQPHKEMKVYQLTGYVTEKLHYQHGGAAMDETITKMAQIFDGAQTMPLLVPISNGFGDKDQGRGKTSAARYIEVKLNSKMTDIMFPRKDDFLLEYAYDDGEKCEPKYVPIMPMAILNTTTTVSVGWRILSWARDFKFTLEQVRSMIKFDSPDHPTMKPLSFKGKAWLAKGMSAPVTLYSKGSAKPVEVCLGKYTYNDKTNIVQVTQLPLKVWSYQLKCDLLGLTPWDEKTTTNKAGTPIPRKDLVEDVVDETGNNTVDMQIKLKPGAFQEICEKYGTSDIDPLEDYLGLKQNMAHDINMISVDGTVMEFKTYGQVVEHWFPVRKQLYLDRLERERLLLEFEIIYYEQVQKYIQMEKDEIINLNDIEPDAQEEVLVQNEFVRINDTLLFAPKFTKANELKIMIFGNPETGEFGKATYNYILDKITKRMASTKAIKERAELIEQKKAELEKLLEITWKEVWLSELDELEKVVDEGIRTKWLYGMKQHTFKKMNSKNIKNASKKAKESESESESDEEAAETD